MADPASPPGGSIRDGLALADLGAMAVERRTVAGRPALVVDGVYADPAAVRALALTLDYHRAAGLYPGHFAFVSIAPVAIVALVNDLLGEALPRPLVCSGHYRDLAFAITATPPADLVPLQRQPHFDSFCDYAGVVYLGPPDASDGGTSFWRHRRTGLDRAPGDRATTDAATTAGVRAMMMEGLVDPAPGYPVADTLHWAIAEVVAMRFNRLVIYDARAFHAPHVPVFAAATDPAAARLTQNLFLDFALPRPLP